MKMNIKIILYLITIPITLWTLLSLNIENFFKKGHINQIKVFYVLLLFSISYLVVNFFYDFYIVTKIY